MADPWLKTINPPKIIRTINNGIIQNFFLAMINLIISFKKLINNSNNSIIIFLSIKLIKSINKFK